MRIYLVNLKKFYGGGLFLLASAVLLGWGYLLSQFWGTSPVVVPEPVYRGSGEEKKIALTMNVDRGEEFLPSVLDITDDHEARITFFVSGRFAKNFPDIVKEINDRGHELGNHSYSHPYPSKISKDDSLDEIRRAEEIIYKITGKRSKLFSPPHGERPDSVLRAAEEAGHQTIMWSVDTVDWQRPGPAVITDRVLSKAHNGAIVLMHPTGPTLAALPGIIKKLKDDGYELVTVSNLIADSI